MSRLDRLPPLDLLRQRRLQRGLPAAVPPPAPAAPLLRRGLGLGLAAALGPPRRGPVSLFLASRCGEKR